MAKNANYVQIPRDLNNIQQKYFMGLTKRQLMFCGVGAALGIGVFFLLKDVDFTGAIMALALVVIPFGFLGMYEKKQAALRALHKTLHQGEFPKTEAAALQIAEYLHGFRGRNLL